ncbi:MAG: hypothetical protein FJW36_22065 [Acidobacteria bacterium]|nr:hypothetical protein [Acidobacteriota bacterium]
MSTQALNAAIRPIGLLVDALIDPKSAAKPLGEERSWVVAAAIGGALTFYLAHEMMPFTLQALRSSIPNGTESRQVEEMIASFYRYQRIGAAISPLLLVGKWLVIACIVYVGCVLSDVRANLKNLFAIVSHCGFIPICQDLLTLAVLRLRGESIESSADLVVRFGPDLFIRPEGKLLLGALSFLNLFHVWYYISLALLISFMESAPKRRGFLAVAPLAILHFLFVVGSTLLQ